MSRICYLHMGLHKTASTTLQRLLLNNVDKLKDAGLHLVSTATNGYRSQHGHLAEEIRGELAGGHLTALREELKAEGLPQKIVLSAEAFSTSIERNENRRKIASYFGDMGYCLRAIIYVRPQEAMMNGVYTQRTKILRDEGSFETYVRKGLEQVRFDYPRHLFPLLRDPEFSVDIRPFNKSTVESSIEVDFLTSLDIPQTHISRFKHQPVWNRSPSAKTIAMCRAVIENWLRMELLWMKIRDDESRLL